MSSSIGTLNTYNIPSSFLRVCATRVLKHGAVGKEESRELASSRTVETAKEDVRRSLQRVGEGALSRAAWALPVLLVNLKPLESRK